MDPESETDAGIVLVSPGMERRTRRRMARDASPEPEAGNYFRMKSQRMKQNKTRRVRNNGKVITSVCCECPERNPGASDKN